MNDTLANHLVVGLGGTGGSIVRALRKSIYRNFRAEDPPNVNLRYLYVDSSDALMALGDPSWKILGTSVQLPPTSQLKISGLNVSHVLDNLNDYPGISPWLGSRERLRQIILGADAANIAGMQKRRLGRFLFASRVKLFRQQVQALVREMQIGNVAETVFHVCCGLAGGTGSGTVVDAVCQLRSMFATDNYRIIIYAFIPEQQPPENRAGPNYHANGYAALLELNALSIGVYKPWDVSGTSKTRLELKDPFNACYLFTDENEDRNKYDVDRDLPEIMASFLFQKIVATRDILWSGQNGDRIRGQERFELGKSADEAEVDPATKQPERTRRFFTFGTKQIAYPEEEIREYLTYTFARQAALQLQFNNWSASFGYVDEPANLSFRESVRSVDQLERWQLSDEHLMLEIGILPDEKTNFRWKKIDEYWMALLPNFKRVVQSEGASQDTWLSALYSLCQENFDQNYRDIGVRRFYDAKRSEHREHVREIRRVIEADLFETWLSGGKSVADVAETLSALLASLRERQGIVEERIARLTDAEKAAVGRVKDNGSRWAQTGVLGKLLGDRPRIFNSQAEALTALFQVRTKLEGKRYQKDLLVVLIAELTKLAAEVNDAASTITAATSDFTNAVAQRLVEQRQEKAQHRSQEQDMQKLPQQQVIFFYKPEAIRDFTRALVLNEEQQRIQTQAVRAAVAGRLGDAASFTVFNERVTEQGFKDILTATSQQTAVAAHDSFVNSHREREPILRVSVLTRLAKEYGGNREALHKYITQVVSKAKSFLVFDHNEVQRVIKGNELLGPMYSQTTIVLPEAEEQLEFRKTLVEEFKSATPGEKQVVANPKRPNEITLINITSQFPARFVEEVAYLKQRYDSLLATGDAEKARFELHGEGDGTEYPDLFVPRITPEDILPLLLLAAALNIVTSIEDPETGSRAMYLVTRDKSGRDNLPTKLGKTLAEAVEKVDTLSFGLLKAEINALLNKEYRHREKREALLASVQQAVDAVKAERPNPLDKTRQSYIVAERQVEGLLAKA